MTMAELDREVNRRLRKRAWKRYGWIVCNPLTALIVVYAALACVFNILGWTE